MLTRRSDLRKEALGKSSMARTLGRGTAAARDYLSADTSHSQIAVVQAAELKFRTKEEQARQAEERSSLTKAFKIEKGRFEAEWANRIAEV